MKKIVRFKCKSLCPLSNEGVHSQLNNIEDMLDTLNKFEEGEAKKAESGTCICKMSLPLSSRKEIDTIPTTI